MQMDHRLTSAIVVPRNGYVNRLQAWASAAIMAKELGVELRVMWEPEAIASASAEDLFDPSIVRDQFMSAEELLGIVGGAHSALPRYLTCDQDRNLLILAGHDLGEQVFMNPLQDFLYDPKCPSTLLIIAGGKFALSPTTNFTERRGEFYRGIPWKMEIQDRVQEALLNREPYCGLHIRGTDRSREAPTARQITRALIQLQQNGDPRSLFVAADTAKARQQWIVRARQLGFQPWGADHEVRDRGDRAAGHDAIVDWIILTRAFRSIYVTESSFGEESVVANENQQTPISLTANATRRLLRTGHQWLKAGGRRARRAINMS